MNEHLRVRDLSSGLRSRLDPDAKVEVFGAFRPHPRRKHEASPAQAMNSAELLHLMTWGNASADTVRLHLPEAAPVVHGKKVGGAQFNPTPQQKSETCKGRAEGAWWNGWGPVLVASGLVPPVVDAVRMLDLLADYRAGLRLRMYCDTNALATGVAAWLAMVFEGQIDLLTSAVVDRELAAWPDRLGERMWGARDPQAWQLRTVYRLARRVIETPPRDVVVDRLSPQQSALMLAKLRDEDPTQQKSPDADMLLIELARGITRDEPRNVRTVYLTGDRNHARAATSALGARRVLYAVADHKRARASCDRLCARGWWRPSTPLGAVSRLSIGAFVWTWLAPCQRLVLSQGERSWWLEPATSVPRGVPSDWEDPWLSIEEVARGITLRPETPPRRAAKIRRSPAETSALDAAVPERPAPFAHAGDARDALDAQEQRAEPAASWLLSPRVPGAPVEANASLMLSVQAIFKALSQIVGEGEVGPLDGLSKTGRQVTLRALQALEVIDASGNAGPAAPEVIKAWRTHDLDGLHAVFLRLPGYQAMRDALALEARPAKAWSRYQRSQLSMMRALGQAAAGQEQRLWIGDRPLSEDTLVAALDRWLPRDGKALTTVRLCELALIELSVSPFRIEQALKTLWRRRPQLFIQPATGGEAQGGSSESVLFTDGRTYHMEAVSTDALSFGRKGLVRFLTRRS